MHRLRAQIDENYEALAIDLGVTIETILGDRVLAPQNYDESLFWHADSLVRSPHPADLAPVG